MVKKRASGNSKPRKKRAPPGSTKIMRILVPVDLALKPNKRTGRAFIRAKKTKVMRRRKPRGNTKFMT